jgi:hypothetical protein
VAAGELLIEAKALVGHGQWLPWLREHCDMPERTAQLYMRLANNKDDLKNRNVADLGIRGAVAEITKSLVPETDIDPRDCLPPSGFIAVGKCVDAEIWVAPSYQHPGYFYLTKIESDGKDGSIVDGARRPVRHDWVPVMVRHLQPHGRISWERVSCGPWAFNVFLFDSPSAFVDNLSSDPSVDRSVLVELATGKPPDWPDLPDAGGGVLGVSAA